MNWVPNKVRRTQHFFPAGLFVTTFLVTIAALCAPPDAESARKTFGTQRSEGLPFPHRKLSNVTFVAFDTETTGVNPKKDRIVEIGAVKYQDGKIIAEKSWLINPQRDIPWWAQRVHGITTKMVRDAPSFKEAYPEFLKFMEGAVLVAHNAPFDIAFVDRELKRARLEAPPNLVIDSLGLFRTWFPDLESHALNAVAEHAKVTGDDFHRALADSMYVARIFNDHAKTLDPSVKLGDIYTDAGGVLKF